MIKYKKSYCYVCVQHKLYMSKIQETAKQVECIFEGSTIYQGSYCLLLFVYRVDLADILDIDIGKTVDFIERNLIYSSLTLHYYLHVSNKYFSM